MIKLWDEWDMPKSYIGQAPIKIRACQIDDVMEPKMLASSEKKFHLPGWSVVLVIGCAVLVFLCIILLVLEYCRKDKTDDDAEAAELMGNVFS